MAGHRWHVNACTRGGQGGSPTAVVIDDATLTDDDRHAIARRTAVHAARLRSACNRVSPTRVSRLLHLRTLADRRNGRGPHVRPRDGVTEDIANANSLGCLAAHLLDTSGNGEIEVHQRDTLGRPPSIRPAPSCGRRPTPSARRAGNDRACSLSWDSGHDRDRQAVPQVRASLRRVVDLTHHNTNRFVLVEGPVIAVRAVAKPG
jgi:predicted PhzF superfamily epimerase YddE/YHI9